MVEFFFQFNTYKQLLKEFPELPNYLTDRTAPVRKGTTAIALTGQAFRSKLEGLS